MDELQKSYKRAEEVENILREFTNNDIARSITEFEIIKYNEWRFKFNEVIEDMDQARMYYLVRMKRGMGSILRLNERLSTIINQNTYIGSFLEEIEGEGRPMTLEDLHRRIVM